METTSASIDPSTLIDQLKSYASDMAGWLKFLGICQILVGIPSLIVLVGALYIWMGVLLYQAGSAAGTGPDQDFARMMSKLKTYFIITGVLVILGILSMIVWTVFLGASLSSLSSNSFGMLM